MEILRWDVFVGGEKNSIGYSSVCGGIFRKLKCGLEACLFLAFFVILALYAHPCLAQSTVAPEYQIKAAFLYKFCNYVEWPSSAFSSLDSPLMLGVAGPDDLVEELKDAVRGLSINNRPLSVRQVDSEDDIQNLHLLFISRSEQHRMPHLLTLERGHPVLLVTESRYGLEEGSVINFVVQDNRVRFNISQTAAEQQGLKLSAQLLKVAHTVQKGAPTIEKDTRTIQKGILP